MCQKEIEMKHGKEIPIWQRIICGVFAVLGVFSFYINPPSDLSFSWSNTYAIFKFVAAVIGFLLFAYFALVGKLPKENSRERKAT